MGIDLPGKGSGLDLNEVPSFVYWSSDVVMDGCHQMTEYVFERYKKKIRRISHVIFLVQQIPM
jgi:hypothetical protein